MARWRARNQNRWYAYACLLLSAAFIASLLLGVFVWPEGSSAFHGLCSSITDAALIAVLVIFFVEPYTRQRFLNESGNDLVWSFANPNVPIELKDALAKWIGDRHIFTRTDWHVTFDEVDGRDDLVKLTITVTAFGRNLDAKAYDPAKRTWILASVEGYESKYSNWQLSCDHLSFEQHYDERHEAIPATAVKIEADGTVHLDETVLHTIKIPPGGEYRRKKTGVMFQHRNGYLPLVHTSPNLLTTFAVKGNATKALAVTLLHGDDAHEFTPETGIWTSDSVLLPQQVAILSWKPSDALDLDFGISD